MGRGIALQFKQAYPAMFREYERACSAGEVRIGRMHVFDLGELAKKPRWILNFPTKEHWRAKSQLPDIQAGLEDLRRNIQKLQIRSIALPPLGCGLGGLDWKDVLPQIQASLAELPEVRVLVFAPTGAPAASAMPNRTERPRLTQGRAALLMMIDRYLKGMLDPFASLLAVQKLMYFLQEAGEPLKLKYEAYDHGPYAKNLRQVLIRLEKHYTQGYGEGRDDPKQTIELLPGAVSEAMSFLAGCKQLQQRMERVSVLIDGYEDQYGLELLSSLHWVMQQRPEARTDPAAAVAAVHAWNEGKRRRLKTEHLLKAWDRLKQQHWDQSLVGA
jgi:O-acetyl-ADP-ribose deacetylase (regulator of RNase III)